MAVLDVNEKEWRSGVEKHLGDVPHVAALDGVVIKEHVGHLHQGLMHSVLSVQEREMVSCIDKA